MSSRIRNIEFVLMINWTFWISAQSGAMKDCSNSFPSGDIDFVVRRVNYHKTTITRSGKVLTFLKMSINDAFDELTFPTEHKKLIVASRT